jgi:hypothetical protein
MARDLFVALPIAAAIFLVRFIAAEAVYQRAQQRGAGLRFPAGLGLRLIFRLGGPFMLYAAYQVFSGATTNFDRGLPISIAVMGLGCLLAEPGPISTKATGLVQTSLLGLRRKRIDWGGAAARYVPGLREVLVIGTDGTTITHSQYHVGQMQFITQLKRHGIYLQGVDPGPR